jgi:hypothetical protein
MDRILNPAGWRHGVGAYRSHYGRNAIQSADLLRATLQSVLCGWSCEAGVPVP